MNCANCGEPLRERGCKVRCPRCGCFEDCSDPSAPGDWSAPRPSPDPNERDPDESAG